MGLIVLTAAPVTALVEVATVRTRLGLSDTAAVNALLAELIEEQTDAILNELGRPVVRQQYVETQPQTGRQRLVLQQRAIDPESLSISIDGSDLAATDYTVEDAALGVLYRDSGWGSASAVPGQDGEPVVSVTYKAGRLIPETATRIGVVSTWTAATVYAVGAWARPLALAKASPLRFECTTAGTSHATTEPTWPTAAGSTVDDGTVVWTARTASEMPRSVRSAAWLAVQNAHAQQTREAGLSARSGQGYSESYFATHVELPLPPNVLRTIAQLRPWL